MFQATDSTGATFSLNGSIDSTGQTFTSVTSLAPGAQVAVVPLSGVPHDRSTATPVGGYTTLFPANTGRRCIAFQVPGGVQSIWISWTGIASPGALGSFQFLPQTQFIKLDVDVVGTGAITVMSVPGGVMIPASESLSS